MIKNPYAFIGCIEAQAINQADAPMEVIEFYKLTLKRAEKTFEVAENMIIKNYFDQRIKNLESQVEAISA